MRVGIDLDGTVTQTIELWVEHLQGFSAEDMKPEFRGAPAHVDAWYAKHQKILRHSYKPYPGAIAILSLIQEPIVITARNTDNAACPATLVWMHKHHLRHVPLVHATDKVAACKEYDVQIHIEDNPAHALALANAGVRVLLKDQPYNTEVTHKNITRFTHWLEVPRILKKHHEHRNRHRQHDRKHL